MLCLFITLCLFIQICLQEHCTDAKLNIEHRNEDDKTNKLHKDNEPIACRNEAAYRFAKAVRRQKKELNIQLHPNESSAAIVSDCKGNEEGEMVTVNYWLKDIVLLESDKAIIQCPKSWLNSSIIDATQTVLSKQFPDLNGFQSVGCGQGMTFSIMKGKFVQILHDEQRIHWITITNIGTEKPNCVLCMTACSKSHHQTFINRSLA